MKKIIAFIIILTMIFSAASIPAAAAEIKNGKTDYPYIFVHGMGGWGSETPYYSLSPYWGGGLMPGSETDIIEILNENGIEAYAPSVGPLSSAWDRACELYAQLTGTVVDYGKAHSEAHGHDRYGFSYEGKATMGEPWNLKDKINLVGHSFGGATVRLFTSLLAFGDADEIAATGKDTSPLFKGGYDDCIHACITLSAPHNGSQVANQLVDPEFTMAIMATALNMIGMVFGNDFLVFAFQLGHMGLTPKQDEFRACLSIDGINSYYKTNDNCGYDMTLRGAAELNEKIRLSPNTYYYSYTTENTWDITEYELPADGLNLIFYISSMMLASSKGKTVDGIKIEGDWAKNDGIVPLASARYPSCDEEIALSYEAEIEKGNKIKPGRWYYFEPMTGMDHFDFCGTKDYPEGFEEFYFGMVNTANSR